MWALATARGEEASPKAQPHEGCNAQHTHSSDPEWELWVAVVAEGCMDTHLVTVARRALLWATLLVSRELLGEGGHWAEWPASCFLSISRKYRVNSVANKQGFKLTFSLLTQQQKINSHQNFCSLSQIAFPVHNARSDTRWQQQAELQALAISSSTWPTTTARLWPKRCRQHRAATLSPHWELPLDTFI